MATLDASIYGNQRQFTQPDPIAQYGQLAQLQGALNQQDVQKMQMAELQRSQGEEANLRQLMMQHGGDLSKVVPAAYAGGMYKQGMALEKEQSAVAEQRAKAAKEQAETILKQYDVKKAQLARVSSAFGALAQNPTPEGARATLDSLKAEGLNVSRAEQMLASGMPVDAWAKQIAMEGVSADKQLEEARHRAEVIAVPQGTTTQLVRKVGGEAVGAPMAHKDEFTQALKQAGIDPQSPQGQAKYAELVAKKVSHPPAPNVALSVSGEKSLLTNIGDKLADQVTGATAAAQASVGTLQNISTLRQAIESGRLTAGPGADATIVARRIADKFGIGGKDNAEILANTKNAMQALARQELAGAQQMKGQGQITEKEREIIVRAETGNINMSIPELTALADALEKTARFTIRRNQQNVQKLQSNPNAKALTTFMEVPEPAKGGEWKIEQVK